MIFENRGQWDPTFKAFFNDVVRYGSATKQINKGILSTYWRRRISLELLKHVANCILTKIGRVNSPVHHDESNWQGIIHDQGEYTRVRGGGRFI